ncbi:phage minor tail protein L [Edaphovirga cremea]|uniref:phage minor tail protein L n=1 Tax=Edaphovirga cremea TaxID=2267246 RepID=UPI003989F550
MTMNADLQKLEPGNRIRLYEIDGNKFDAGILRFHGDTIPHTPEEIAAAGGDDSKLLAKSIWWQGEEYSAWPCQIEGLEMSSDGQSAQPKLSVANLNGSITALCIYFNDMVQAKVTIHETFKHYLDGANFPEGNPEADPNQEFIQVFYIDSKSNENNEVVEFTLSSPADLEGLMIPTRQIHSLCTWAMRGWYRTGKGCAYAGQNGAFTLDDKPTDDPSRDVCAGLLSSCNRRFGQNEQLDFGGFPGSALIKR